MPANVINLEEVVPGLSGTTFEMPDGKKYHVPGDLPTETVFKMLALFEELVSFEEKSATAMSKEASSASISKVREGLKAVTDRINEELLAIFRLSDPKLETLPFGSQTTAVVLGEVFKALGLASDGGRQELPSPPPVAPRRGGKKTTKRSTKTAGSRKGQKAK
jgi:hypothetical protein